MEIKLDKNKKVKVGNPEDVYPIMKAILLRENRIGRAQEHFWMVGLNQIDMNKVEVSRKGFKPTVIENASAKIPG